MRLIQMLRKESDGGQMHNLAHARREDFRADSLTKEFSQGRRADEGSPGQQRLECWRSSTCQHKVTEQFVFLVEWLARNSTWPRHHCIRRGRDSRSYVCLFRNMGMSGSCLLIFICPARASHLCADHLCSTMHETHEICVCVAASLTARTYRSLRLRMNFEISDTPLFLAFASKRRASPWRSSPEVEEELCDFHMEDRNDNRCSSSHPTEDDEMEVEKVNWDGKSNSSESEDGEEED